MDSNSNVTAGPGVSRHPQYYFDEPGCHIFLVDNVLYKLSIATLSRHSQVLADMFTAAKEDLDEGENDDNPIEIPQLESSTFDFFVEHHFGFPRIGSRYTNEELLAFLAFCDKYECDTTKVFVVNRIQALSWRFHSAVLMELATTYRLPSLFRTAFLALTDISLMELTKEQHSMIGPDVFISLAIAKSVLDRHCRIIAAEEPAIIAHTEDCKDPPACAADWHGVWWNGMGRYLLDGRNPQPYKEAVRRFKSEMEFGRVGKGCKTKMFQLLEEGAAFQRAENFVNELCDYLITQFHLDS